MAHIEDVPIRDESIRLGQFLKLANLIDSGSDAKELMIQGAVTVNGEVETRRGRQLVPGDVVALGGVGPESRRPSRAGSTSDKPDGVQASLTFSGVATPENVRSPVAGETGSPSGRRPGPPRRSASRRA